MILEGQFTFVSSLCPNTYCWANFDMRKSFLVFISIAVVSLALVGCTTPESTERSRVDTVSLAQQADIEAETQINRAIENYGNARAGVVAAIERIKDPQKKEVARQIFEKNEQAWDALLESETLLRQGAKSAAEPPDIRYRRIADAERTSARIVQLHDFADWIHERFE